MAVEQGTGNTGYVMPEWRLIELGLRYPPLEIDRTVFEKTPKEREFLKFVKSQFKRKK